MRGRWREGGREGDIQSESGNTLLMKKGGTWLSLCPPGTREAGSGFGSETTTGCV